MLPSGTIGKRFGKLLIISEGDPKSFASGGSKPTVNCLCDCGTTKTIVWASIKNSVSASCGCLRKELLGNRKRTHGASSTKLFHRWQSMRARCYTKTHAHYKDYGGRGIKMCDEWKNNFESFQRWALENGYSEELSLDRKEVNGNYEPDNCRWVDQVAQMNNTRVNVRITIGNETKSLTEWCKHFNIRTSAMFNMYYKSGITALDEYLRNVQCNLDIPAIS